MRLAAGTGLLLMLAACGGQGTTGPSSSTPAPRRQRTARPGDLGPGQQHRERPLRERHHLRSRDLELPDDRRRPGGHRLGRPAPALLGRHPHASAGERLRGPPDRQLRDVRGQVLHLGTGRDGGRAARRREGGRGADPAGGRAGLCGRALRLQQRRHGRAHHGCAERPRPARPRRLPAGLWAGLQPWRRLSAAAGVLQLLRPACTDDGRAPGQPAPEPGVAVPPGQQRPARLAAGRFPDRCAHRDRLARLRHRHAGQQRPRVRPGLHDRRLGNVTTTFNGADYSGSYLDTGSNGLYFLDDSTIGLPACPGEDSGYSCPRSTLGFTATNRGSNGASGTVSFSIANAEQLFSTGNNALGNLGGPDTGEFDWGLPFFFGRTTFIGIEGQRSSAATGPYWAY